MPDLLLSLSIHPLVTAALCFFSLHPDAFTLFFFFLTIFLFHNLPSLSLSLSIRHSKISLLHVEVITPSLSLPHSVSLIFLNLPAQSEVRISFSLFLINLLHLPFYFHLPPSLSLSPSSARSLSSGSSSPAAFLILLLAQFVSPIPPQLSSHSASCQQQTAQVICVWAPLFLSPSLSIFQSQFGFLSSLALCSKDSRDSCIQPCLLTPSCVLTRLAMGRWKADVNTCFIALNV